MERLESTWKYALSVLGVAVLVLLIMDFNSRMAELRRLTAEKERVGAQATRLVKTNVYLTTQIAYATSDTAVDEFARVNKHWVKPGDNAFAPIAPANGTPLPIPTAAVTPQVVTHWDQWMALFAGKSAP